MINYQGMPDVQFIVGRPFDTEYGHHEPGEVFKQARAMYNLDVLVSAGLLYPYFPDSEYNYLPPHLFSLVMTHQEAQDKLQGDPSGHKGVERFPDAEKPEVVKQSEREAELQELAYEQIRQQAAVRQRQAFGVLKDEPTNSVPTPAVPAEKQEELAEVENKEAAKDSPEKKVVPVRKVAAKKTAPTKK